MRPINLLPPEAHRRAAARRKLLLFVGLGVAYILLLALVALWWRTKVTDAAAELEAQQALNAELQAQIAQLEGARVLKAEYDGGVQMLEAALARDVAWGRLLNDLGRVIPDRVWLSSFSGQIAEESENEAVVGQISTNGTAFEYPDVASWLRTVDSDQFPALTGAWVSSASLGSIGEAEVVNFASIASLTRASLSDRLEERIPRVPE